MNIDENFYFNPTEKLTASVSNSALRKYAESFGTCSALEGDFPIIIDTNILLGYYGMSKKEKEKLIEFLDTYKPRIVLTKQVEEEFLRNRLSVIKRDFFGPLHKIADDYNKMRSNIEGQLKSFREDKKKIFEQDYPELYEKIQTIESEVKVIVKNDEFLEEIKSKVEETTSDHKNIALVDDLLDRVSNFTTTEVLTEEELKFLKEKFDELISQHKAQRDSVKWKFTIPGCGEDKDEAEGDYIIYNEALKYMKDKSTSVIFLTNDVKKGDWLQLDKNPHNHYIEQTYRLTENILFIVHAERTLPKISFENIHSNEIEEVDKIQEISEKTVYESTIINLDTDKGFGFIYTKDSNLYFRYSDYEGNFRELSKNDIVTFEKITNAHGEVRAANVKKVVYDFNSDNHPIMESEISHINHYRGIGFISYQPENLYFHQLFVDDDSEEFERYVIGMPIEFLVGYNDEGEKIARKVRRKREENQPATLHLRP